ncbi:TPA: hypothetical protein ACICB7_003603 [Klebsiella aerogenes]|nr:hypothetical protein [Klebsiella aerogenes]
MRIVRQQVIVISGDAKQSCRFAGYNPSLLIARHAAQVNAQPAAAAQRLVAFAPVQFS